MFAKSRGELNHAKEKNRPKTGWYRKRAREKRGMVVPSMGRLKKFNKHTGEKSNELGESSAHKPSLAHNRAVKAR